MNPEVWVFRKAAREFLDDLPDSDCTLEEALKAAREDERRAMCEKWGIAPHILSACPTHGRVQHLYDVASNAYVCRLIRNGCRHFVPREACDDA